MNVTQPPRIEIDDEDRVAAALASLQQARRSDLRVECVLTGERFDIEDFAIEDGGERLTLSLTAEGLPRERFDAGVRLHASLGVEALLFSGIAVQAFRIEQEPAALVIAKPARVHVSNKRESTRIRLVRGMRALVQLQVYEDRNPVDARLMDLSLGGCGIEIELRAGMLLRAGQDVFALFIEFPNGTRASLPATVRHVQLAERNGHAYVGFAFARRDDARRNGVVQWLREMEREIAFRAGHGSNHLIQPSRLFLGGTESRVSIRLDRQEHQPPTNNTPMVASLRRVAHVLGDTAIALRQERALPIERLYESADTLGRLLDENRAEFLYALCCLPEQPPVIQHCIAAAGRLADLVQSEDILASNRRDITVAALVHDLGNVLEAGPHTASTDPLITDPAHPTNSHTGLLAALGPAASWAAGGARRAVIERLNTPADALPEAPASVAVDLLTRAAYVVDMIDVMSRGVGDREPKAPLQIFRELYHASGEDDRRWVERYMKRHGLYPIGSLVHFSSGFLAWVLRLGDDGQPSRIRVVRDVGGQRRLNQILDRADFGQVGTIERPGLPQRFGVTPY